MYNILIADDETIILSGIKFLIDWETHDCTIQDTARNGQDALDKITACPPDIVLCDINMPVMNGIELLKLCHEKFPSVVFIMLTNLQEFDLAREAIRFQAIDYLLKVQLEATALEESLKKAKEEADRRSSLIKADRIQLFDEKKMQLRFQDAWMELLFSPDSAEKEHAADILAENHMLDGYGLLYIPFDYTQIPGAQTMNASERSRLTAWEKELGSRLADHIFEKHYLFIPTGQNDSLTIFLWGQKNEWQEHISLFTAKFSNAAQNITQAAPNVLATGCFRGKENLWKCRNEYLSRIEYFYLDLPLSDKEQSYDRPAFEPLGLSGIGSQLEIEINSRNLTGCTLLLDKAVRRVSETFHQKSQGIWLCNELYRSAARALKNSSLSAAAYSDIESLMTRRQIIQWIETLKNTLTEIIWQNANLKSEPVEKAHQYVLSHIEDRLTLQDVADEVNISAGYLSTLFKKQYNQSFVSFINQAKIEHSCRLIREKQYLISDIAYRLGFENAYYFAKVFRKYMGMTPSDYEKAAARRRQL